MILDFDFDLDLAYGLRSFRSSLSVCVGLFGGKFRGNSL